MHYFVTGATGFIGKRLVKTLLARRGATVHFLLRPESEGKVAALLEYWGVTKRRRCRYSATSPRRSSASLPTTSRSSRARSTTSTTWPRSTTCRPTKRRRSGSTSRARATRSSSPRRSTPATCTTCRSIAAAGLYEGVFREDMFDEAEDFEHPVLHDQAREREDRAQGVQGALDGVPPGDGGGRQQHRRDGQDRRPVLLLQADPAHAPDPAAVDAQRRPGRRAHQHRAGGFRGRRAGPHQPPKRESTSKLLPPGRPGGLPRGRRARHLQPGRACAQDEPVHQRRAARLHPEEREEGPDGAGAGAPRAQRDHEGPGPARRHADLRQLPDAFRLPRHRGGAQGLGHRVPEPEGLRVAAVGLLGAPPRPGAADRPLAARHGGRQGGAGHRRLVGHRPGRGAQVRRGRRHHRDLRARPGQAGRSLRSRPARGDRSSPTRSTSPTRKTATPLSSC